MGRAAITLGTSDGRPGILDRSGDGSIRFDQGQPEILPAALLELARHCQGLRESRGKIRPSKETIAGQEVDRTTSGPSSRCPTANVSSTASPPWSSRRSAFAPARRGG